MQSRHMRRELYGRGLIGSLKATTWWQQLQEKQNKAAQQSAPLKDGVRVQASPPCSFSPSSPAPHFCL